MSASPPPSSRPSRHAARKAAAALASYQQELPDHFRDMDEDGLLSEALAPMKDSDREDYKAWVEMESDPAYFSGVLKDLGVGDAKVQELFEVTEEAVQQLPQPVYGFVFCCRYESEDQEGTEKAPQDLWFANQTMPNGCATVALINIVMNNPTISLGPTLSAFKASTAPLTPLVRGYRLDSHPRIRQTHNAFARRIEHLNADLALSNEFEEEDGDPDAAALKRENKKRKAAAQAASAAKRRVGSGSAALKPKLKRKPKPTDTCHYKAFLPALDQVWVLDGLEANPVSLAPIASVPNDGVKSVDDIKTDDDAKPDEGARPDGDSSKNTQPKTAAAPQPWTTAAIVSMQAKMADAGELVNILAVCQSPTRHLRAQLVDNIARLELAHNKKNKTRDPSSPSAAAAAAVDPEVLRCPTQSPDDQKQEQQDAAGRLAAFGIDAADVRERMAELDAEEKHIAADGAAAAAAGQPDRSEVAVYETRQRELVVAYNTEVMNAEGDEARCRERKEDFAAAIHKWVEKLADKRMLQTLAEG